MICVAAYGHMCRWRGIKLYYYYNTVATERSFCSVIMYA